MPRDTIEIAFDVDLNNKIGAVTIIMHNNGCVSFELDDAHYNFILTPQHLMFIANTLAMMEYGYGQAESGASEESRRKSVEIPGTNGEIH